MYGKGRFSVLSLYDFFNGTVIAKKIRAFFTKVYCRSDDKIGIKSFLRRLSLNRSESEYYDDIYPSSLKRQPSVIKRVSSHFSLYFACLWNKLLHYLG